MRNEDNRRLCEIDLCEQPTDAGIEALSDRVVRVSHLTRLPSVDRTLLPLPEACRLGVNDDECMTIVFYGLDPLTRGVLRF